MGNICCDARRKQVEPTSSKLSLNPQKANFNSRRSHQKVRSSRRSAKQPKGIKDWNNFLGKYLANIGIAATKEGSFSVNEDEDLPIDYEPQQPQLKNREQRSNMMQVLERFHKQEDHFDCFFDGTYHKDPERIKCTVRLTSQSLWLLDRNDFSSVCLLYTSPSPRDS